jgi:flavodoxin
MKSIHDKIILFSHEGGMVYKVATKLSESLKIPKVSSQTFPNLENYSLVIIVTSNYGDEELPLPMEQFLLKIKEKNKFFTIIELGNYYGYDEYNFGAQKIIKNYLQSLDLQEFFPSLSLDSFPKMDIGLFLSWKEKLEHYVQNNLH